MDKIRLRVVEAAAVGFSLLLAGVACVACYTFLDDQIRGYQFEAEFFGPGGVREREPQVWADLAAGRAAIELRKLDEAERRFATAIDRIGRTTTVLGWDTDRAFAREKSEALAGLAEVSRLRGSFPEAAALYLRAIEAHEVLVPEFLTQTQSDSGENIIEIRKRLDSLIRPF